MNLFPLPVIRDIAVVKTLAFIVALLMAIASLIGILFQAPIYPSQNLRQSFVPNDVVNLFIGLPILLGSLWLIQLGKLLGLLFLPGALFYIVYNYIAYLVAMPINAMSLMYLALVASSTYAMIQLLARIDVNQVQRQLAGAVPARLGGGVLLGFGLVFLFRSIGVIVGSPAISADFAVAVADLVITPAWIIGGILLWRRHPFGYALGLGLLFQASMLFIALLVFFALQPMMTPAPFAIADAVVIFIMGLVCFIPFSLFVRGAVSKEIVQ